MIRRLLLAAAAALSCAAAAESARETTLIPQTLYIGDRGRLVVALDSVLAAPGRESTVVDRPELLPKSAAVHIHRVELERRQDSTRALIDFTAFEPGQVLLPTLEIGGVQLAGLRVTIESALEAGASELSPPEDALAAPGTFLLLYGGIFALLAAAALAFLLAVRGLPAFRAHLARRGRGRAARSLRRILARLRDNGAALNGERFFTMLLVELRGYLSVRTGRDCRALTAAEYPPALGAEAVSPRFSADELSFLASLFRRGDEVRFGALPLGAAEREASLDGVSALVDRLEAAP